MQTAHSSLQPRSEMTNADERKSLSTIKLVECPMSYQTSLLRFWSLKYVMGSLHMNDVPLDSTEIRLCLHNGADND